MSGTDRIAVQVQEITHRYGTRTALSGITFALPRGAAMALLGPNGSGKSTLFRILATVLRPTSGRAMICGEEISGHPDDARRRLGVVFQRPALDPFLTVMQNLRAHGHLYGMRGGDLASRIGSMLELVELSGRRHDRVATLSGGLQRRVELAKALLHRPEVLLLDEPSAGLDPAARRGLMDHLERLAGEQHVTILMTTHLIDEAERCGLVGVMHEGRLVALDAPGRLRGMIAGDVVAIQPRDPAALASIAESIRRRFGVEPVRHGASLRVALPAARQLAQEIMEAHQGELSEVSWGIPTLDDVYLRLTGRRLATDEASA